MSQAHELDQVLAFTFEALKSAIRAIDNGDPEKAKRLLERVKEPLALQTLLHTKASIGSPFMNSLLMTLHKPTDMDDEDV